MARRQDVLRKVRSTAAAERARQFGRGVFGEQALVLPNLENNPRFIVRLPRDELPPGVSAMIRAKNEVANVPLVLPAILGLFDEVIFVDNKSTDGTLAAVADIAQNHEFGHRLRIASYPFAVARCGEEHWSTPESSVHNLAFFYNWCLARCGFATVFKWDMDMVPIPSQRERLASMLRLAAHGNHVCSVECQTIYRAADGQWWAANDEVNKEPRLHPNHADARYHKARQWETLRVDLDVDNHHLAGAAIYELKDTTVDEFTHWTDTDDLSPRKRVEYENFLAIRSGLTDPARFTMVDRQDLPNLWTSSTLPKSQDA